MIFSENTIVKLVSNKANSRDSSYKAFKKGEERLYKVIRGYSDPWRNGNYCVCMWVDQQTQTKRIGSWTYYLKTEDLIPFRLGPINLQDWM